MTVRTIYKILIMAAVSFSNAQCGVSVNMLTSVSGDTTTGTATDQDADTDSATDSQTEFATATSNYSSDDTDSATDSQTESATATSDLSSDDFDTTTTAQGDTNGDTASETSVEKETDTEACPPSGVLPTEVLMIGDSWISLSCDEIGGAARSDGILGVNDDYVCRATFGATMEVIVSQYDQYVNNTGTAVKVIIMNGGAVDTYGPLGTQQSVTSVVESFRSFLTRLGNEGSVTDVIYSLYADVLLPADVDLKTPMQDVCTSSDVSCHFIELQPLWAENSHYTSDDGVNPSQEGADAIANAIWDTMTARCIAQ